MGADYWALWGKTRQRGDAGDETHALIHHMADVGAVAGALWEGVIAKAVRYDLCRALGVASDEMGSILAWLASLHDLGKASPAFQAKHVPAIPKLQAAGLRVGKQGSAAAHHSVLGHCLLLAELPHVINAPPRVARRLAAVLGGHHGVWQNTPPDIPYWETGDTGWDRVRHALVGTLTELFARPLPGRWPVDERELNSLMAVLAGLVTTADWLGSMAECFPCRKGPSDLGAYLRDARMQAQEAVQRLLPAHAPDGASEPLFERLFPGYTPNDMQKATISLGGRLAGPSLVIIEAPTGCGKTEAALYLAEHLRAKQGGAGAYIAMPTMTTSNQMHERVTQALKSAYPGRMLPPLLVHGQALWQAPLPAVTAEEGDETAFTDPMAWFLPRKRSLLAPYGVGTVDQALLSVLPTRHFYVRLYGLARKTVIFDEVHAYDTYMSTLFERLLAWLHALGSSAIILSATLPAATRQRLLDAFGPAGGEASGAPCFYPALSWRSESQGGVESLPAGSHEREVELRRLARETVLDDLRAALIEGGCAAVICNTVGRAQAMYLALQEADLVPPDELYLFHARYPQAWRNEIEGRVLERFGKERRRRASERAILVATQVVEQSLDLDLDYMLTDLAPIDLLIQRAGRLHRHMRGAEERPQRLHRPILTLIEPPTAAGVPQVDDDGPMYEPYVLLRTLLALEGRQKLHTPADTSGLIAAVYDEAMEADLVKAPALRDALSAARAEMERRMRAEVEEAKCRLIVGPESPRFVGGGPEILAEDDPTVHHSLQALTRLAEPSVQVVCLHQHGEKLSTEPDGSAPVQIEPIDHQMARTLARSSVSVTHRGAVFALLAQAPPPAWVRHPFLRHCRPAVFADGVCRLPGSTYALRLTRELGLQVTKEVP